MHRNTWCIPLGTGGAERAVFVASAPPEGILRLPAGISVPSCTSSYGCTGGNVPDPEVLGQVG